jgi:uncharacterized protein (TIGR03000 family)
MYSVVLMAALATSGETPDLGRRGGCHGCRGGCYGGCYGYGCHGCYGGYSYGCHGCYGGGYAYGCYGGGCYGVPVMPGAHHGKPEDTKKKMGSLAGPNAATIVVNLPADARLMVDDKPTTSTGERRVLVSPDLTPGKEYYYTLKAEAMRDGQTVKVEQRVDVRAGRETPVTLVLPPTGVARGTTALRD